MPREVYVLMRDVGEYEDRDTSPVLATSDKTDAEAALARAMAHEWPAIADLHDYDSPPPMPEWETPDALAMLRTYGLPSYRLETVRATQPSDIPREHVEMLHAAVVKQVAHEERLAVSLPDDEAVTHEYAHSTLSEVAESLRVLLEGEVRDGE